MNYGTLNLFFRIFFFFFKPLCYLTEKNLDELDIHIAPDKVFSFLIEK